MTAVLSTTLPPRIRPLRECHLDQVSAIEVRCHDRPWSAAVFRSEMAAAGRHYLGAWSNGVRQRRLLGYGGIMVAAAEVHVTNVAVDPVVRRRAVGSHLLVALLEEGLRRGATAATLEVRASNLGALRLYGGFGFAPVGVRPGYYATTREDAIIMWLHDLDGPDVAARLRDRRLALGLAPLADGDGR